MNASAAFYAVVVDDASPLTLDDLARACAVEPQWVVERVEAGLIGEFAHVSRTTWRFEAPHLARARQMAALERDMGANPELAALVADLSDELRQLRLRLRALGAAGRG